MIKKNQNVYSVKERKNQNVYSVKEKNYKCQIWKKFFFEQDCTVRLSIAYWGEEKKSDSIFLWQKKIAPFFKFLCSKVLPEYLFLKCFNMFNSFVTFVFPALSIN